MRYLLPKKEKLQKGQTVLVVLLVMTVLLTLGLSAVSRSVTDVKISQQTQESARAFWTAQAGLEKALLTQDLSGGGSDGVTYTLNKLSLGGAKDFVFPEKISPRESVLYWLVGHDSAGNIDIGATSFYSGNNLTLYWGNFPADVPAPALVATLIYKDTVGNFRSHKFAYDPAPATRSTATSFSSPDSGTNFSFKDNTFAYKATLPAFSALSGVATPKKLYFLNIRMIFNTPPQILGVQTEGEAFPGPAQGSCYESTATVTASNIVRKLSECRTWPKTPEIFDYLLFSGGSLD